MPTQLNSVHERSMDKGGMEYMVVGVPPCLSGNTTRECGDGVMQDEVSEKSLRRAPSRVEHTPIGAPAHTSISIMHTHVTAGLRAVVRQRSPEKITLFYGLQAVAHPAREKNIFKGRPKTHVGEQLPPNRHATQRVNKCIFVALHTPVLCPFVLHRRVAASLELVPG